MPYVNKRENIISLLLMLHKFYLFIYPLIGPKEAVLERLIPCNSLFFLVKGENSIKLTRGQRVKAKPFRIQSLAVSHYKRNQVHRWTGIQNKIKTLQATNIC